MHADINAKRDSSVLVASPAFSHVLIDEHADLGAAYGAVAPPLTRVGAPPLVTAARIAGPGVPGALIEVSAIAALMPA